MKLSNRKIQLLLKNRSASGEITNLIPIYALREKKARDKRNQAITEVKRIQEEIAERTGKVMVLKEKMTSARAHQVNAETTSIQDISSDYLVSIDRYLGHVSYDLEKESFYLEMTIGELAVAQEELSVRNAEVIRIEHKRDVLKQMVVRKDAMELDRFETMELEESKASPIL